MANSKRKRARKRKTLRRLEAKHRRQNLLVTGGIGLIAILFLGLLIYEAARPRPGMAMPDLGNPHIQPPEKGVYNSYPPTSGPHYTNLASWGIHETPISNELQVHNLEDGGVMVQYSCPEGCTELVSQLTKVVERYDHGVILAPYPDMEARIALTAWNRIDKFKTFDEARIVKFIKTYHGLDHH
jgi:hypothetical protein